MEKIDQIETFFDGSQGSLPPNFTKGETAMENQEMTSHDVFCHVFDCQKKIGMLYETIRSIARRDFGQPFTTDREVAACCMMEAENSLKDVFETLKDVCNQSHQWAAAETVEGGAA